MHMSPWLIELLKVNSGKMKFNFHSRLIINVYFAEIQIQARTTL